MPGNDDVVPNEVTWLPLGVENAHDRGGPGTLQVWIDPVLGKTGAHGLGRIQPVDTREQKPVVLH